MFEVPRRLILLARVFARFVSPARVRAWLDIRSLIGVSLIMAGACAQGVEVLPELGDAEPPDDASVLDAEDADELSDAGVTEEDPRDASDEMDGGDTARDAGARDGGQGAEAGEGVDAGQLDASASDAMPSDGAQDAAPAYSCPGCKLKVQWNTSTSASSSQSIAGYLKLSNTGTTPIALSGVSVRYWLREAQAESLVVECYYWDSGAGANKCTRAEDAGVNGYSQMSVRIGSGTNNLRYIELSFTASAGELAPGGTAPGAMQLVFHQPSYAAMDQSDDPSFDTALAGTGSGMLFDAPKISAYLGGQLSWGVEPSP